VLDPHVRRFYDPRVPSGSSPTAEQVFSAVARRVLTLHPGDEDGRMLQSRGLKTSGKFYAFATPADVVVKLPASRVNELIESGTGRTCSPQPGRPMREWVGLAGLDADSCLDYLLEARAFVVAAADRGTSPDRPPSG